MSEENKAADQDAKVFAKQARQQLKIQCLEAAIRNTACEGSSDDIVTKAKAFYAFARS